MHRQVDAFDERIHSHDESLAACCTACRPTVIDVRLMPGEVTLLSAEDARDVEGAQTSISPERQ